MKMPHISIWYKLSLRIIALFFTAMIVSFSPELLRGFFGDTPSSSGYGMIDENWNWGFRHTLYFLMCICLFFVQAIRLAMWIDENKKEFKA